MFIAFVPVRFRINRADTEIESNNLESLVESLLSFTVHELLR